MNNARRKRIAEVRGKLEELAATVREIAGEESDAFESMPEGLQQSERGQATEAAASTLESTADEMDNSVSSLTELEES